MATVAGDLFRSVFRSRSEVGGPLTRHVSKYTLALADLLEAEGRVLKERIVSVGIGLGFVVVAAVLGAVGSCLVMLAFYRWLLGLTSPEAATLVTGVVTLCGAAGGLYLARSVTRT